MTDGRPVHEILESGRAQIGLEVEQLWTEYLALGGNAPLDTLAAYLDGRRLPSRQDYDYLAQCLNEHFRDRGRDSPLPYAEDVGL